MMPYPAPTMLPGPAFARPVRQIGLSWVPMSGAGGVPARAVQVGPDIYVARAIHGQELIPGKASPMLHRLAFVPYNGQEISVTQYEILCDTSMPCFGPGYSWVRCSGAYLPAEALVGGHTASGEPLYIAKGVMGGEAVVGKVYKPHGCAYFPWGGAEHASHEFEVLVVN